MPTISCVGKAVAALGAGLVGVAAESSRAQCTYMWEQVASNNTPAGRSGGALVYDEARQELVLVAGSTLLPANRNQTWVYANGNWTLRSQNSPRASTLFASCYDRARSCVVIFGGTGAGVIGETYEWDGSAWNLRATTGPSPRSSSSMVYDTARNVCVLFGGSGRTAAEITLEDTWEWDGSSWRVRTIPGPPARFGHSMVYDQTRAEVVMFGGSNLTTGSLCDTWSFDGQEWRQRASSGPGLRTQCTMAYDPVRNATVLIAGHSVGIGSTSDTWVWDGNAWSLSGIGTLPNRNRTVLAYVPPMGGLMCFSGSSTGLNDFRLLRSETALPTLFVPSDQIVSQGTNVRVEAPVAASGATYAWDRWPARISTDGPTGFGSVITGSNTRLLDISNAQRADTGICQALISTPCGRASVGQLLVVLCPADFDEDENVTADDLAEYINDYFSGLSMRTDFNHDGVIDSEDLIEYINSYFGPCR